MQDRIKTPASLGEIVEAEVMTDQAPTTTQDLKEKPFSLAESSPMVFALLIDNLITRNEINIEDKIEITEKIFEFTLASKKPDLALLILSDLFQKADSPEQIKLVLEKLKIKENLLGLIKANDYESFEKLFNFFQENISQENKTDFTVILNPLLHRCCMEGLNDFAKLILRQGYFVVSVNYGEQYFIPTFECACKNCDTDVVELIFNRRGADINAINIFRLTPLHFACQSGNLKTVKYLGERGAVIDAKNNSGNTPLHFACQYGKLEIVKYLLEKGGADILATGDKFGNSPLHLACQWDRLEIVKYLVERGAVIDAKDNNGRTPLHDACIVASRLHNFETVKYLLERGANVYEIDNLGRIPFYNLQDNDRRSAINFYQNLLGRIPFGNLQDNDRRSAIDFYHNLHLHLHGRRQENLLENPQVSGVESPRAQRARCTPALCAIS